MTALDAMVVAAAVAVSVGPWQFFFGTRGASRAEMLGGVQEARLFVATASGDAESLAEEMLHVGLTVTDPGA